jgi:hypothetical protein
MISKEYSRQLGERRNSNEVLMQSEYENNPKDYSRSDGNYRRFCADDSFFRDKNRALSS